MKLFLILCAIGLVSASNLAPDSLKFYHDITSGKGLYSNFDKIITLNDTNFKENVYNNSTSWIVEFYNSWCGHCHRFAPVWKRLTLDIYNWRSVVKVGAVDCSNQANTHLCRQYEVMYYPTVKYFSRSSPEKFLGTLVKQRTLNDLKNYIIDKLKDMTDLPQLTHFSGTFQDIWKLTNETNILAVIDNNSSYIGQELALDLIKTQGIRVVPIESTNSDIIDSLAVTSTPAIYFIEKHKGVELISIEKFTRMEILKSLDDLLIPKGLKMPPPIDYSEIDDMTIDISQAIVLMQIEDQIKKKLHSNEISDTVFQVDIEGALIQTLMTEIPSKKHISGEMFAALLNYIEILYKYFPIGRNGIGFLGCIKNKLVGKAHIDGSDFYTLSTMCQNNNEQVFLESQERWLGCKGSKMNLRGYPCSLWTMFHTLTIQADLKGSEDPKQVLKGMIGYIKHFFGCTECSKHFQQMASTMSGNVTNTEDSIIWLWKAHNVVNNRLQKDETEDPSHPKVQFPPENMCKNCSQDGIWNETAVLEFLRKMYSKISFIVIEDIAQPSTTESSSTPLVSKSLKHEMHVDENQVSFRKFENRNPSFLSEFNFFDVGLCIILYLFSMGIILLVCFRFYKKTYRKKNYFDIFQKV